MASSNTSRLSAASLAAALPGRSRAASASPVASAKQNIGWNPNPPLKLGAVPSLFSEWISTSDASISKITGSSPPVTAGMRSHTSPRILPIAWRARTNVSPSRLSVNVRYNVESEHTSPNRRPWAANDSISVHDSPPPASINIA